MKDQKKSIEWISGAINWYDTNTGRGSIIGDDGVWYRIHEFVELKGLVKRELKSKARVQFELAKGSVHPIVQTVRDGKTVSQVTGKSTRARTFRPAKDVEA